MFSHACEPKTRSPCHTLKPNRANVKKHTITIENKTNTHIGPRVCFILVMKPELSETELDAKPITPPTKLAM